MLTSVLGCVNYFVSQARDVLTSKNEKRHWMKCAQIVTPCPHFRMCNYGI